MYVNITRSKNIVHINTKAKRPQPPYLQEVWPFYSLTSVKDGIISNTCSKYKRKLKIGIENMLMV